VEDVSQQKRENNVDDFLTVWNFKDVFLDENLALPPIRDIDCTI